MTLLWMRKSVPTTAAAVSSQEVSIPRSSVKSGWSGAEEGGAQRLVALLELLLQNAAGPHDEGVFPVVAVVVTPYPHVAEPVLAVEVLRRHVGAAHLQLDPARPPLAGPVDQRDEQPLADALSSHRRIDGASE